VCRPVEQLRLKFPAPNHFPERKGLALLLAIYLLYRTGSLLSLIVFTDYFSLMPFANFRRIDSTSLDTPDLLLSTSFLSLLCLTSVRSLSFDRLPSLTKRNRDFWFFSLFPYPLLFEFVHPLYSI